MDKRTRFYKLEIPLLEKDYGRSAAEVLETCALVAAYAQEHTRDQIKAFQEKVKINPQVWWRLLALHRDERLKKHLKNLPASYTALYAIHRMTDEEIDAAVKQGVITPRASSHSILSWKKQNRLGSTNAAMPPWRCLVVFDEEIDKKTFLTMRHKLDEVAKDYGARLVSEHDYIRTEPDQDDGKQRLIEELEHKIRAEALPLFNGMTERERNKVGISSLDNFYDVDLRAFRGLVYPPLEGVKRGRSSGRQGNYQPVYVYRLALEFLKTDSRSQRFNYKRRLMQLAEDQPDLKQVIEEVLETYMKR